MSSTSTENSSKKILIIDDHRVMSQGLSILLKNDRALDVCGMATSYNEAIDLINKKNPDVVLVDLHLGDENGLDLVKEINASHPNILSIILSSQDENIFAGRCIRAGAKGYVMKDKSFDVIIDAIKRVLDGDVFVSENVKQQLLQQSLFGGKSNTIDADLLSDREFEIFQLIGEGFRQRQIAEKLCISTTTVNKHCQNMKSKLQLDSMDELIERSCDWFNKK